MGKLTISMAISNSYFDITRGYTPRLNFEALRPGPAIIQTANPDPSCLEVSRPRQKPKAAGCSVPKRSNTSDTSGDRNLLSTSVCLLMPPDAHRKKNLENQLMVDHFPYFPTRKPLLFQIFLDVESSSCRP